MGNTRPQVGSQARNFSVHSGEAKDDPHKIKHGKDGRRIAPRKKASAGEGSKE